jgi:hypothetical protein
MSDGLLLRYRPTEDIRRCGVSIHLVGSRLAGTRQRLWLGAWALIVLFLHAACAMDVPRGGLLVGSPYRPQTPRFHGDARPPSHG